MPIITVDMFEGRTAEQKRALVAELTDAFARTTGVEASVVQVVIREVSRENWAIGGVRYSDR